MTNTQSQEFLWGTATSSYQIEGAAYEGNRGASIWDTFSHTPGLVKGGDTGDVAIDHFHRYKEDIKLMADLGINSYRFSIAWPRLFPHDMDHVEEQGIDFYNKIIDELLAHGIVPAITLYHWDLPQYLEDRGGWANRETAYAFAKFSRLCAEKFGDRVTNWITLNEPWCTTYLGYYIGVHAPGLKNLEKTVAAAHHTALAHGLGTRAIREVRPDVKIGLTVNMANFLTDSTDSDTAKAWDIVDANQNRWWIDAFIYGKYPQCLIDAYGENLTKVFLDGDGELLKVTTDFLGVNFYSDGFIGKARPTDNPMSLHSPYPYDVTANMEMPESLMIGRTDFGWPITPAGLGNLLVRIHKEWPQIPSLYVTENGCAFNDEPQADGTVQDLRRVKYLEEHVASMQSAIDRGAPVHGYFAWSLLDNFEWAEGYSKRFGLIFVDFETQKRTPKQSYFTYQSIIKSSKS
jgi:beta-glucosidase